MTSGAVMPARRASTRNTGVDALRLVSISAVVLGHAYLSRLEFAEYLEVWRMPLFFFLSGYFWTRGRAFVPDLRGRWTALAVPYLVWAVIMSAVAWRWSEGDLERFGELMRAGWYGGADQEPPWWAFWFISVLFFTTVLRRLLERFPSPVAWLLSFAGLWVSYAVPDSWIARTPLGIGLAFPCLFFILAGELFRRRIEPNVVRHRALIGTALILGGLAAVAAGLEPHNIKFGGFGTPVLTPLVGTAMAAGAVLVFGSFVNRLLRILSERTGAGRAIRRGISALVRTGTAVVLVHGAVLMELIDLGVTDPFTKWVLTLLISWAIGLILLATPLSRLLTGVPRQYHPFRRRLVRGPSPAPQDGS
jgi:fucose 4-O-acetylase-like acetyltransferase